jgi:hypothetical protein
MGYDQHWDRSAPGSIAGEDWFEKILDKRMQELDPDRTRVRATLGVTRNGDHDQPLRLAGDGLKPLKVRVDGGETRWTMDGGTLVVEINGNEASIETDVEIAPAANSKLMGLFASGGNLCTQCESEGFRRITFHPDRPDVLSRYRVRMSADKARFPILLANGNLVQSGDGDGGTHFAEWEDPFPKPCYLFALVLASIQQRHFTTINGREVSPNIWVREKDLSRCSTPWMPQAAMRWESSGIKRRTSTSSTSSLPTTSTSARWRTRDSIFSTALHPGRRGYRDRHRLRQYRRGRGP